MALLTVGSGALLVGRDLIGLRLAVDLDWVLWTAGTVGGLVPGRFAADALFDDDLAIVAGGQHDGRRELGAVVKVASAPSLPSRP